MVEAILRAMCPDLPMPLTIARPRCPSRQAWMTCSASRKRASSRSISARTASASTASTRRASSSALWSVRVAACRMVRTALIIAAKYNSASATDFPKSMDATGLALQPVLVLLAGGVLAVVACRSLGLPPVIGYLAAGVILGPHALGVVADTQAVRHLAEFGVVFLMFSIGLEFSLPRLRAMGRSVFGLGLAQVAASIALCVAAALAAGGSWQA